MTVLTVNRTGAYASKLCPLVVGNVNSIDISFIFSPEWSGLNKIAVFSNGSSKVSVSLTGNSCTVPWEVLANAGEVFVSLRGSGSGGSLVICTEEVSLGKVSASNASVNAALAGNATASVIDTLAADVAELKGVGGTGINSLTEENTLADSDEVGFFDTSADASRKTAWSNIKSKLKAYFDNIYLSTHQSLAAYQPKSITDTGGYFTGGTVEAALQEIGAELSGINTLLGSGVIE